MEAEPGEQNRGATGGGGLVKKLLFPAFDAGSNDTFEATQASTTAPLDTGSVISFATTAVHDNRTHRLSNNEATSTKATTSTPQRIKPFFSSTRPQTTTPSNNAQSSTYLHSSSASPHSSLDSASSAPAINPNPTSNSSSVRRSASEDSAEVAPYPSGSSTTDSPPSSPPALSRANPAMAQRTLSTVTMAQGETSGNKAANSQRNAVDFIDQQQRLRTAMSSTKPPGGEDDETDAIDKDAHPPAHQDEDGPQWEEEATPAQTAFAKQVLFASTRNNVDVCTPGSDILSTASERGTVIGMAEIDDMLPLSPAVPGSSHFPQPEPSAAEPAFWQDSPELDLPILDESAEKSSEVHRSSDSSSNAQKRTAHFLTNAIRRIGSGVKAGSVSAPTTPRTTVDTANTSPWDSPHYANNEVSSVSRFPGATTPASAMTSQHRFTPSSFLLRSPGSMAFSNAQQQNSLEQQEQQPRFQISPSRWIQHRRQNPSSKSNSNNDSSALHTPMLKPKFSGRSRGSSAMKLARSCFSFDAYDTSMDHLFDVSMNNDDLLSGSPSLPEYRGKTSVFTNHIPNDAVDESRYFIKSSTSWDVSGPSPPHQRRPKPAQQPQRVRILNEQFATTKTTAITSTPSPNRVVIERDDALDILACLAERGVCNAASRMDQTTDKCDPLITMAIEELTSLSLGKKPMKNGTATLQHSGRVRVLEQLVRSHEYALEMRRASQSAMSWLKSIDREEKPIKKKNANLDPNLSTLAMAGQDGTPQKLSDPTESGDEGMDALTSKAMLHAAQLEAKEKGELADRLNEELAKCRAEIGRLQSKATNRSFNAPNRSILDDSDDVVDEETPADAKVEADESFESSTPIIGVDESGFIDPSFLQEGDIKTDIFETETNLRDALIEANNKIVQLESQLRSSHHVSREEVDGIRTGSGSTGISNSPGNKETQTINVRMLDGENFVTEWSELAPGLPPPPDHGLHAPIVGAVMEEWSPDEALHDSLLDWMDRVLQGQDVSTIPPLTISNLGHQVRDGFVMHVLPLLLRRADIRVDVKTRAHRFTTYDLNVAVEPTLSLIGVRRHLENVSAQSDVGTGFNSTTHSEATTHVATNVPHKNTFLTPKGNVISQHMAQPRSSPLSYDEVAEVGLGSERPVGLMSTLGGALGGLLRSGNTTRKNGQSTDTSGTPESKALSPQLDSNAATLAVNAANAHLQQQKNGKEGDEEPPNDADKVNNNNNNNLQHEPYHRIVTAPSGRIGVTFVEYRGHAMVSDVAKDSPLVGWIFPSDILIAIDELPVSGKPVRDIIKVLRDRKSRQRALRVISSHAMEELLPVNTSAVSMDARG